MEVNTEYGEDFRRGNRLYLGKPGKTARDDI